MARAPFLLSIHALPPGADPRTVAAAANLPALDAALRLRGGLPRVLTWHVSRERLDHAAAAVRGLGGDAAIFPLEAVPTDAARVVVATAEPGGGRLYLRARDGRRLLLRVDDIRLVQAGWRTLPRERRRPAAPEPVVDPGPAPLRPPEPGQREVARRKFLLLQGPPATEEIIFYDGDWRWVGPPGTAPLGPAYATMQGLVDWLDARHPALPLDDRAGRPMFRDGLPALSVDRTDLALFLVRLDRARRGGRA